jgi:hypothetical protein
MAQPLWTQADIFKQCRNQDFTMSFYKTQWDIKIFYQLTGNLFVDNRATSCGKCRSTSGWPLSRNIWSHFEHNIRQRNEGAKSYTKHKSLAKRIDAGNKQRQ